MSIWSRFSDAMTSRVRHISRMTTSKLRDDYFDELKFDAQDKRGFKQARSWKFKEADRNSSRSSSTGSDSSQDGYQDKRPNDHQSDHQSDRRQIEEDLKLFNLTYPSSLAELQKTRIQTLKKYHPDRFHGDVKKEEVAKEMIQIYNAAYERLSKRLS